MFRVTVDTFHECLRRYPGLALELSVDGRVQASNGRLEVLVGRPAEGEPFAELLDESSLEKWASILNARSGNPACTWELVLAAPSSLELRTFLAVWGRVDGESILWLLEHSPDPKLELLYGELAALNSELADAQRKLARERAQLARALETARGAVTARDEILAIVSHDLRNALNGIVGMASLLARRNTDHALEEPIALIEHRSVQMTRLISDLLDVSAVAAGGLSVEPSDVDLLPTILQTCQTAGLEAEEKAVKLSPELPAALPQVRADPQRIEQVLLNLLSNAVKFTPAGGTVQVRAAALRSELIISIRDTGPGIRPEELPLIFERFWRISRTRRGGTGLGLAIAKGIVDAHGGRVWVESEFGEGATFFFALPLVDGGADATDGPP